MRNYMYQPLEPGMIRLLRLNPLSSPKKDALTGSIFHHSLTNPTYHERDDGSGYLSRAQDYVALSYHWGSNTKTPYQILIDEPDGTRSVLRITTPVYSYLRLAVSSQKEIVLWIDAICIDQVSSMVSKEKEEQIKMMPDIYRIATVVNIDIGQYVGGAMAAIQLIYLLSDYAEYLDETHQNGAGGGLAAAMAKGLFLPPADDAQWVAMRAFWRRPWFRRMWVIQEFVHATEVVMTCGGMAVDWRKIWLGAKAYVYNKDVLSWDYKPRIWEAELKRHRDSYREAHEGARTFVSIVDMRMKSCGWLSADMNRLLAETQIEAGEDMAHPLRAFLRVFDELAASTRNSFLKMRSEGKPFAFQQQEFLELIDVTRGFCATQPVDRLYALLSLASDANDLETIYSKQQTISVVTRRFALYFIERGKGSQVLEKAGIRSNTASSANEVSWAPHWTDLKYMDEQPLGLTTLGRVLEDLAKKYGESLQNGSLRLYNASLGVDMEHRVDADRNVLTVKGRIVDTVKVLTPGNLTYGTPFYLQTVFELGNRYYTGEPMKEALWRTMTANRQFQGLPAPDRFDSQFDSLLQYENNILVYQMQGLLIFTVVAIPLIALVIVHLPLFVPAGVLTVLMVTRLLPVSYGCLVIAACPVLGLSEFFILMPAFYAIAFMGVPRFFPILPLKLAHRLGLTIKRTRGIVPPECAEVWKSMVLMENYYKLAVTAQRRLALVPPLTKEGDVVAVIHGCDTPSVIRLAREPDRARLVGEAYVHGLMAGEALGCHHGLEYEAVDIHLI